MQAVTIQIPVESENEVSLKAQRASLIQAADALNLKIAVLETELAEAKEKLALALLAANCILDKIIENERPLN